MLFILIVWDFGLEVKDKYEKEKKNIWTYYTLLSIFFTFILNKRMKNIV